MAGSHERLFWRAEKAQESWLIFKDSLFKAQEQFLPTCRKRSKHGRRPAQKNKEFLTKLNAKRKYREGGR